LVKEGNKQMEEQKISTLEISFTLKHSGGLVPLTEKEAKDIYETLKKHFEKETKVIFNPPTPSYPNTSPYFPVVQPFISKEQIVVSPLTVTCDITSTTGVRP
jgi:hypothetical protein